MQVMADSITVTGIQERYRHYGPQAKRDIEFLLIRLSDLELHLGLSGSLLKEELIVHGRRATELSKAVQSMETLLKESV